MNPLTSVPFLVTRRDLDKRFASKTLAGQMIKAGWIALVRPGKPGREALYDFASARVAYLRLKSGEDPQVQDEGGRNG